MLVVRFKVQCQPDRTDEVLAAMRAVVEPSRALPGVVRFDVARDVTDRNALVAIEVFEDHAAMDKQESQPEVAAVIALLEGGAATSEPEWTVFDATPAATPAP
jgi:quinol monooxygenase YgiN